MKVSLYSVFAKDLPHEDSNSVHIVVARSEDAACRQVRNAYAVHLVPPNGYPMDMFEAVKINNFAWRS